MDDTTSAWVTDELFRYLTNEKRVEKTRQFIQDGTRSVLAPSGFFNPEQLEQIEAVTATRLLTNFGEDSDCYGELETWPECLAFSLNQFIRFDILATRLLQEFAPAFYHDDEKDD
jgi:hypothetical protein